MDTVKLPGSFRPTTSIPHLHGNRIFTEHLPRTVPQSLHLSCASELHSNLLVSKKYGLYLYPILVWILACSLYGVPFLLRGSLGIAVSILTNGCRFHRYSKFFKIDYSIRGQVMSTRKGIALTLLLSPTSFNIRLLTHDAPCVWATIIFTIVLCIAAEVGLSLARPHCPYGLRGEPSRIVSEDSPRRRCLRFIWLASLRIFTRPCGCKWIFRFIIATTRRKIKKSRRFSVCKEYCKKNGTMISRSSDKERTQ